MQPPSPPQPVIVRITEPSSDPSGLGALADVLLGSLGLAGGILLLAVVTGVVLGGLMFWIRSRST